MITYTRYFPAIRSALRPRFSCGWSSVALLALAFATLARQADAQIIVAEPILLVAAPQMSAPSSTQPQMQANQFTRVAEAAAQSPAPLAGDSRVENSLSASEPKRLPLGEKTAAGEQKSKFPSFMPAQLTISQINIRVKPNVSDDSASMPTDYAKLVQADLPPVNAARADEMAVSWHATMQRHAGTVPYQPLYFEEVNLERYGRSCGPLQPAASIARFFATVPTLPYAMTVHHPHQVNCWTWPYQAGWGAPRVRELSPFNPKAGLVEAGIVTGMVALIP